MAFQWMRRVLLAAAPAALLVLAACGSGSIESQLVPARIVVFGDALSDMGQAGGKRYTVNDTSKTWTELVATDYGLTTLKASSAGGTNYATGNARVSLKPDAAGNSATPTVKEQVDTFLAGNTPGANDLIILQGGISDIIVQMQAFIAGTQTSDQMLANVKQAGLDLADQARRLKAAGASHIAIIGAYDLSFTPWGISTGKQALLTQATTTFNSAILVSLVNEGESMLYLDTALEFNLLATNPASFALVNVVDPACNSIDPGPGIGVGTGKVNSLLCTTTTVNTGVDYASYLWADPVYPTPTGHARFASFVFTRVHDRW
jgi:phospholipase/lecithinase/hemolysin